MSCCRSKADKAVVENAKANTDQFNLKDVTRTETRAMRDTQDTYLGKYATSIIQNYQPHANQSGFVHLEDAIDALRIERLDAQQ